QFLFDYNKNEEFLKLEKHFNDGANTVIRLNAQKKHIISQEKFDEFLNNLKKKNFYDELFSDKINLEEVINYYDYLNETTESDYITMHKTKGSGIKNVMVILDEYFWPKYNFKSIYDDSTDADKKLKNQKLFYVACSRTIKNLVIVRLVED